MTLTREAILAAETGALRKDPGGRLRIALAYPNTYAVGMSNLAIHTLYRLLNARPDVVCERVFLPKTPTTRLRTLESDTPLADMDVVAFSIAFELDYPNVIRMLRQGGVEPFAARRTGPRVIAGGATMSYNPEPLAPILDAVLVGEAEHSLDALVAALRDDTLERVPGVYVPAHGAVPTPRLVTADLDAIPVATTIYTPHTEFGTMALVEVGRGCPYGCRFCVASHVYAPARWRSLSALLPVIDEGLRHRARIGLLGASVTDHPDIVPLCEAILARGGEPSPASMRADALAPALLTLLARGGVRTITLAPEAGTEALRRSVGKRVSDDALLQAAARAREAGIAQLKLYFILGLPGETPDDRAAIPVLARRLARETGMRVSLGCSVLVPKPGTPFARVAMAPEGEMRRALDELRRALRGTAELTHESPRWATWQAVLARGGRELAPVLAAIADGPDTPGAWAAVFRAHELDPDAYTVRAIPPEAPLPWAHIGAGRCLMPDGS
jgi:radical SAM superfamily enzyme YgiQ (UPF0313 family)